MSVTRASESSLNAPVKSNRLSGARPGYVRAQVTGTTGSPVTTSDVGVGYDADVYKWTGDGSITFANDCEVEMMIVSGGGAGGPGFGGGGGGGGIRYFTNAFFPAGTHTITVGDGGAQATSNEAQGRIGEPSIVGEYRVEGGGAGTSGPGNANYGISGACGGGGGGSNGAAGYGSVVGYLGYAGGNGGYLGAGGGGGMGEAGATASSSTGAKGGDGLQYDILVRSTDVYYAGGGAGWSYAYTSAGSGGEGGGGDGVGAGYGAYGVVGTDGLGGGGGPQRGGGSGLVVIRVN